MLTLVAALVLGCAHNARGTCAYCARVAVVAAPVYGHATTYNYAPVAAVDPYYSALVGTYLRQEASQRIVDVNADRVARLTESVNALNSRLASLAQPPPASIPAPTGPTAQQPPYAYPEPAAAIPTPPTQPAPAVGVGVASVPTPVPVPQQPQQPPQPWGASRTAGLAPLPLPPVSGYAADQQVAPQSALQAQQPPAAVPPPPPPAPASQPAPPITLPPVQPQSALPGSSLDLAVHSMLRTDCRKCHSAPANSGGNYVLFNADGSDVALDGGDVLAISERIADGSMPRGKKYSTGEKTIFARWRKEKTPEVFDFLRSVRTQARR